MSAGLQAGLFRPKEAPLAPVLPMAIAQLKDRDRGSRSSSAPPLKPHLMIGQQMELHAPRLGSLPPPSQTSSIPSAVLPQLSSSQPGSRAQSRPESPCSENQFDDRTAPPTVTAGLDKVTQNAITAATRIAWRSWVESGILTVSLAEDANLADLLQSPWNSSVNPVHKALSSRIQSLISKHRLRGAQGMSPWLNTREMLLELLNSPTDLMLEVNELSARRESVLSDGLDRGLRDHLAVQDSQLLQLRAELRRVETENDAVKAELANMRRGPQEALAGAQGRWTQDSPHSYEPEIGELQELLRLKDITVEDLAAQLRGVEEELDHGQERAIEAERTIAELKGLLKNQESELSARDGDVKKVSLEMEAAHEALRRAHEDVAGAREEINVLGDEVNFWKKCASRAEFNGSNSWGFIESPAHPEKAQEGRNRVSPKTSKTVRHDSQSGDSKDPVPVASAARDSELERLQMHVESKEEALAEAQGDIDAAKAQQFAAEASVDCLINLVRDLSLSSTSTVGALGGHVTHVVFSRIEELQKDLEEAMSQLEEAKREQELAGTLAHHNEPAAADMSLESQREINKVLLLARNQEALQSQVSVLTECTVSVQAAPQISVLAERSDIGESRFAQAITQAQLDLSQSSNQSGVGGRSLVVKSLQERIRTLEDALRTKEEEGSMTQQTIALLADQIQQTQTAPPDERCSSPDERNSAEWEIIVQQISTRLQDTQCKLDEAVLRCQQKDTAVNLIHQELNTFRSVLGHLEQSVKLYSNDRQPSSELLRQLNLTFDMLAQIQDPESVAVGQTTSDLVAKQLEVSVATALERNAELEDEIQSLRLQLETEQQRGRRAELRTSQVEAELSRLAEELDATRMLVDLIQSPAKSQRVLKNTVATPSPRQASELAASQLRAKNLDLECRQLREALKLVQSPSPVKPQEPEPMEDIMSLKAQLVAAIEAVEEKDVEVLHLKRLLADEVSTTTALKKEVDEVGPCSSGRF